MNLALWIVTGVLVVVFLAAAVNKLILPKEKLTRAPAAHGSKTSALVRSRSSEPSRSSVSWA
jgi:hypothetical protein